MAMMSRLRPGVRGIRERRGYRESCAEKRQHKSIPVERQVTVAKDRPAVRPRNAGQAYHQNSGVAGRHDCRQAVSLLRRIVMLVTGHKDLQRHEQISDTLCGSQQNDVYHVERWARRWVSDGLMN